MTTLSAIPAGSITAAQIAPGVIPAAGGGTVTAGALIVTSSTTSPAGYSYTGSNLRSASSAWIAKASLFAMSTGSPTVLNGKLYVVTSANTGAIDASSKINEYDPVADTWLAKASLPAVVSTLALTALNGKLYAMSAATTTHTTTTTVTTPSYINEYDPVADTWIVKASTLSMLTLFAPITALNGKLYAIGLINTGTVSAPLYVNNINEYDPVADTWLTKASMLSIVSPNAPITALNGKLYVMAAGNTPPFIYNIIHEYDPVADTWLAKASVPSATSVYLFPITLNGKLYARSMIPAGTTDASGYAVNTYTIHEYNPGVDTWLTRWSSPSLSSAGVSVLNGKLYVRGGINGGTEMRLFKEYDPVTNVWANKTPSLHYGSGTALNNKIYLLDSISASFEEYDPILDTPLHVHVKQ